MLTKQLAVSFNVAVGFVADVFCQGEGTSACAAAVVATVVAVATVICRCRLVAVFLVSVGQANHLQALGCRV